jgi:squalene synthase HpnC
MDQVKRALRRPAAVNHKKSGASAAGSATWTIPAVSVDHYENFPVASVLCPPALRPAVTAIYWFARTADDLADEGTASSADRLRDLDAFQADLLAVAAGGAPSPRWAGVFERLRPVLVQFKLPLNLLNDLLSAFRQDVRQPRYTDRAELLDYCRRSANTIGRLLLHLYGVSASDALRQADDICTALQLANFWQDLSIDRPRGRHYLVESDCRRHGLSIDTASPRDAGAPTLLADLVEWTRGLMHSGAPLAHALPGRAGWELRLVVQGGLRVLEKTEALGAAALTQRPRIGVLDAPLLLWRALWMRPPRPRPVSETP